MAEATTPQVLDLTATPDRPIVRLPNPAGGDPVDVEVRFPEELTFDTFAAQTAIGREIMELAPKASEDGVLEELQTKIVEACQIILVDCPDDVARGITPGQFRRITAFFQQLGDRPAETPSETGSSSAGGSSDSIEEAQAEDEAGPSSA